MCLLTTISNSILKLLLPCYLLVSLFGVMIRCLDFSDSIDEVFNMKLVDISHSDRFRAKRALYSSANSRCPKVFPGR